MEGVLYDDDAYPGTALLLSPAVEPVGGRHSFEPFDGSTGERTLIAILLEDQLTGRTVDDEISEEQRIRMYCPIPGDELLVLVSATGSGTGDSLAIGDKLIITSGGTFIKTTGTPESEPFTVMETMADVVAAGTTLDDGEQREIVFKLGAGRDRDDAAELLGRVRGAAAARNSLEAVWHDWSHRLGAINVDTPDRALNTLANGWLLYQTMACRPVGAKRLLPVGGRIRVPGPTSGRDGARARGAATRAAAPPVVRVAAVPRGRRPALGASALGPGCPHALLGRLSLAAAGRLPLCEHHRRRPRARPLRPGAAGAALAGLARRLVRPRAIVIVSAHWETDVPTVGLATRLGTIHGFGGFPPELYQMRYPATGCPEAAREVAQAIATADLPVDFDARRGLDHGAWVPLRLMFPEADVPVIPLSIQTHRGPAHALRVGRALAPLRERGILVIASGNLTHNLRDYFVAAQSGGHTPSYVREFADWVWNRLEARDVDALLDYRHAMPSAARAHPTEEHLLPLYIALGAGGDECTAARIHAGIDDYVLAMDAFRFNGRHGASA